MADPNQHCATFWEHPASADTAQNPLFFAAYGLLAYDSFYTTPEDWPNDPSAFGNTTIVTIDSQPTVRFAEWYVTPDMPADGGTYTVARFNLIIDCSLCVCPAGECYDYEPFPGAPVCAYFTMEGLFWWVSYGWSSYQIDIPICWYVPDCPGDIDADGDTDLSDLAELLASYGKCPGDDGYNPACNLYENEPPDGCIDLSDLAFLLADYGCGT